MLPISVILPVYNVEKYLTKCLNSLFNQTFSNFEVLAINDGSTDRSLSILKEFALKEPRLKIISQKNQGLAAARNLGLKHALGEYIYFLDSDDFIHPQLLEICYLFANKNQCDLVCFDFLKVFADSFTPPFYHIQNIAYQIFKNPLFQCQKKIPYRISLNVWSKFYKREFLEKHNLSFIPGIIFEDYPFTFSFLFYRPKTVILQCPLYYYRQNPNSISHQAFGEKAIQSYYQGLNFVADIFQKAPQKEHNFLCFKLILPLLNHEYKNIHDKSLYSLFFKQLDSLYQKGFFPFSFKYLSLWLFFKKYQQATKSVVALKGGLGNQMFQYAFSLNLNENTYYDISSYSKKYKKNQTQRFFELQDWNINLKNKLLFKKPFFLPIKKEKQENIYDETLFQDKKGYYTGYFQAPLYFEKFKSKLLKAFTPKDKPNKYVVKMLDMILASNAVSLHIRRGDYIKFSSIYNVCDLNYYYQAINTISKTVSNPTFFIFSDDLNWAKENLKINYPMIFVEKKWDSNIWDIFLMAHCQHNIIANSTFSWWGAWLNQNENKKVIAPNRWFANNTPTDILPKEWIKLPVQVYKIAILFIATGKYICFWDDFYKKMEKYFLPGCPKTYFLFTDSDITVQKNVCKIFQKQRPWPYDTLMRWETFLKVEESLKQFDFIYFINGTMIPTKPIGTEILPNETQELMVVLHPGFYKAPKKTYTYDRNPKSQAYIPENKGEYYFMGGFNGGRAKAFLSLIHQLNKATLKDEKNKVMALWHDESHLNKYMIDKNPLILTPQYGFPEKINFNIKNLKPFLNNYKMLIKDKSNPKYGGHQFLRAPSLKPQIPKIIHYCWFGKGKKTPEIAKYIQSWRQYMPDYEIKEWNEDNLKELKGNKYVMQAYQAKKWAFVADVFRLYALNKYGGIYFDTDVEVKKNFDSLLNYSLFCGIEKYDKYFYVGMGVLGAKKGHPMIQKMLKIYDTLEFIDKNGQFNQTPNTSLVAPLFKKLNFKSSCVQFLNNHEDELVLPYGYLANDSDFGYSVHHFMGSWIDDFKYYNKFSFQLFHKTYILRKYKRLKKNASFHLNKNETQLFLWHIKKNKFFVFIQKEK